MRKLQITNCLNAKSDIGIDELNENLYQCIVTSSELPFNIAHVFGTTPDECERNSDLVSDVINTANKCDMLPSELLDIIKQINDSNFEVSCELQDRIVQLFKK